LIERAGFSKGERWQGAGISSKHALALVNVDGATAADIRELAMRIRNRVRDRFGIALEPEPRFVAMAGLG
jgi:UDP-N-acetylmuramate dehydrogenase